MSCARIERAVGSCCDAPDDGLAGGEDSLEFRRQRQLSVLVQRDAGETALQKILIGVHLPGGAGCGPERTGGTEAKHERPKRGPHSFTSTGTVLDPVTTTLPVWICSSSILEPRGNQIPCAACALLRIKPTEAGGSGRSWPCA